MESHLDRKIQLVEFPEKNLYKWALKEVDSNGEPMKRDYDYIPWNWTTRYTASELLCTRSVSKEQPFRWSDDEEPAVDEKSAVYSEIIVGTLYPGSTRGRSPDYWDEGAVLRMFGTDRIIRSLDLTIVGLDDDNSKERCVMMGVASYTAEIDFRDETEPDYLEVRMWLHAEKFNSLRDQVIAGRVTSVWVSLGNVDGFYAEWSPSVTASQIKVLLDSETHEIQSQDDSAVVPPRLRKVGDFDLYWTTQNELQLMPQYGPMSRKAFAEATGDEFYEEPKELPDEYDELAEPPSSSPSDTQLIMELLIQNQRAINKLGTPLWITAIMLVIVVLFLLL